MGGGVVNYVLAMFRYVVSATAHARALYECDMPDYYAKRHDTETKVSDHNDDGESSDRDSRDITF